MNRSAQKMSFGRKLDRKFCILKASVKNKVGKPFKMPFKNYLYIIEKKAFVKHDFKICRKKPRMLEYESPRFRDFS
jgi:hypothetical protein